MLPVLTYTAPDAAARRAALAPLDARPGARARARELGLRRRGVPVADDPRPGVLGLLAGRHGGVPRQRRHRRRRPPLPWPRRGDERVRARGRARAARRDGAAVAVARAPRRGRALPHRRRDRPGRVHRARRQQRLHEPDGGAEPAGAADAVERHPAAAEALGVDDEEIARWREAAGVDARSRSTSELGVHPQSEGFTRSTTCGTSRHAARASTRCCCTTPTSTSTGSRS